MNNENVRLSEFNQAIQKKLNDDQWDNLIVHNIICLRKDRTRKKIQFIILPGLMVTASFLLFINNGNMNKSSYYSKLFKKNEKSVKNSADQNKKNNFKIHIMDAVFNKLQ